VALYNSLQKDHVIDLAENPNKVLTKSKAHKGIGIFLKRLSDEKQPNSSAYYFDGKSYPTMRNETFAEMKR
jgi:5'-3' exonuclease